jgi:tRNA nucleotidyltransferase/poly(A) polymerase
MLTKACISPSNMRKLIKNYTTDIPVERTITEIQKILAQNGARGIALEYDESGNIKDIFFKIILNNKELPFRLPAKAERVYQALWGEKEEWEYKRYGQGWRQQAERISWRICKTWLEAQITLINLEQAKIEEVFLPYLIMPGNKTLFETMEQNHFLLPDKHNA